MDGREVGNRLGQFHFGRWLDQIGIHTQALTPYYRESNERRAYMDELRIFAEALSPGAIANLTRIRRRSRRPAPFGEKRSTPNYVPATGPSVFGWNHPEAAPAADRAYLDSAAKIRGLPGRQAGLAGSRGWFLRKLLATGD